MPETESERRLADWALNHQLPLERYWDSTDEERRTMVKNLAQQYYRKGSTENYQRLMDRAELWKDVDVIVNVEAEKVAIEPRLRRLEDSVSKIENRQMLLQADADLNKLPYSRLTGNRVDRYDKVNTQLNDLAQIINTIEQETATLSSSPFANRTEAKELASRVPAAQARELGFTRSGGVEVGTSNVRYRHGAAPKQFEIVEYPVGKTDERTGAYTSAFKVYDNEGKLLGQFDHKPSGREIKERWRS